MIKYKCGRVYWWKYEKVVYLFGFFGFSVVQSWSPIGMSEWQDYYIVWTKDLGN